MPASLDEVVDAYWRLHASRGASREERRAAQDELFWAWELVDDTVHSGRQSEILELLDGLLSHPAAEPVYVGAGPLEDLLHEGEAASWDAVLASRCNSSAAWREAMDSVDWPDDAELPLLRPYLRPRVGDSAAAPSKRPKRDAR